MLMPLLLSACTDDQPDTTSTGAGTDSAVNTGVAEYFTGGSEADWVYDKAVMHELEVNLDSDDWAVLREQERSYWDLFGDGCMEGPFESPYTYFEATATYDGEPMGTVGIRKKGLIGSVVADRPSLKIDVAEYVGDQTFFGLDRLVFNNGRQDQSRIRTCLAHEWFASAGLVAPRCALAHVVVNGEDLGVYASTENIDENLIGRQRGEGPASMYEGTLSDFREGWTATFEHETETSTGAELLAVEQALQADDDELLEALDQVVNLEHFYTFWAAEVIAGHWDGYAGNTNNFYAYSLPTDAQLHFIASGPDSAFDSREPFGGQQPAWIVTTSALANRLAQHEEGRRNYETALESLLNESWPESKLESRVDEYKSLVRDYDTPDMRESIDAVREVIEAKADDVREELGAPITVSELRGDFCFVDRGISNVEFSTTWGSYPNGDLFGGGSGLSEYSWDGTAFVPIQNGFSVGDSGDGRALWLTISALSDSVFLAPYVIFDSELVESGVEIPIDGHAADGYLLYMDTAVSAQWSTAGYLDGTLTFSEAGSRSGQPVEGVLRATIVTTGK